jgi:hypothetical protein
LRRTDFPRELGPSGLMGRAADSSPPAVVPAFRPEQIWSKGKRIFHLVRVESVLLGKHQPGSWKYCSTALDMKADWQWHCLRLGLPFVASFFFHPMSSGGTTHMQRRVASHGRPHVRRAASHRTVEASFWSTKMFQSAACSNPLEPAPRPRGE